MTSAIAEHDTTSAEGGTVSRTTGPHLRPLRRVSAASTASTTPIHRWRRDQRHHHRHRRGRQRRPGRGRRRSVDRPEPAGDRRGAGQRLRPRRRHAEGHRHDHPGDGTVAIDDGTVTYTPAAGFSGTDTFDYTITDGIATDTATVTVAVANGAPAAVDDEASTGRNRPVDIAVLANDSDPDGDTLRVTDATTPADGTVDHQRRRHRHLHPGRRVLRDRHLRLHRSPTGSPPTPPPSPSRSPTAPRPRSTTKHRPGGTSQSRSRCWPTTPTPTATP